MTDLEMTRLCAQAMGGKCNDGRIEIFEGSGDYAGTWMSNFDPLHNDAQAMELVKRIIGWMNDSIGIRKFNSYGPPDLNRAIVECVAKMQAAKAVQP